MLFADGGLTAEGWVLIIGAIFFGIQQVVKMILEYRYNRDQRDRDEKVAEKLTDTTAKQDEKLNNIDAKVEVVHKATNSLVTQLVEKTESEAFAKGAKSETDKTHPPKE